MVQKECFALLCFYAVETSIWNKNNNIYSVFKDLPKFDQNILTSFYIRKMNKNKMNKNKMKKKI